MPPYLENQLFTGAFERYLRYVQMNKACGQSENKPIYDRRGWSEGRTDYAFVSDCYKESSIFKREMRGGEFLKKVQLVQQNWIEAEQTRSIA